MTLTAIDLFCGAGGLSRGLERAGFTIVGAVDSWERAVRSYRANFQHPVLEADAAELTAASFWERLRIDPRPLDLIAGGPPCQGFSVQRIGDDHDERNHLVLEFARLVVDFKPRMFLMENVPGLLGRRGEELVGSFTERLSAQGFDCRFAVVRATDCDVPQNRRRVLCVGWDRDRVPPFELEIEENADPPTVWDAIGDLPAPPADGSPAGDDLLHARSRLSPLNQERLRHIPPGGGFEDLPVDLRVDCHKAGADRIGHRNVYGRLAPDRPSVTITARFDSFTRGKFAHPFEDRNITLREGARLQSFDDTFIFEGNREQVAGLIGNAVPPLLAQRVGEQIRAHLERGGEPNRAAKQIGLLDGGGDPRLTRSV